MHNSTTYSDDLNIPGLQKQMPFVVPIGYFEQLPIKILDAIYNQAQIEEDVNAAVPAGYFEGFASKLMAKIKLTESVDELEDIAPALVGISKLMPFSLPVGYFENNNFVQSATKPSIPKLHAPAKVFSFNKIIKYAAAACIAAIVGSGVWYAFQPTSNPNTELASISLDDFEDIPDIDLTDALVSNIDDVSALSLELALGLTTADDALQQFSAEELQQYLQKSGISHLEEVNGM